MSKIALVIPTIRENCFRDLVDRWGPMGLFDQCDLILMEDNPKKTFALEKILPNNFSVHLCWEDIKNDLGFKEAIIPRRSDTVRSYGYYYAWKDGSYDYVLTLDDDCYPPSMETDGYEYKDAKEFVDTHLFAINGKTKWFNTLNNVKPRGIPFYKRGTRDDIIVNHGLWTNVIDYDAPTQLVDPKPENFDFSSTVVPHGSYFPMCGMNVMWKAEYTALMYHLLMGQEIGDVVAATEVGQRDVHLTVKFPFDRFGDIWCGILMKKCADNLGKVVTTGTPYIRHERASNPFTNLKKEANGLEVNEDFWEYVDAFDTPELTDGRESAAELYFYLGKYIEKYTKFPEYVPYFIKLGKAMSLWAELFEDDRGEG